jgi:hypothetical protein
VKEDELERQAKAERKRIMKEKQALVNRQIDERSQRVKQSKLQKEIDEQ